ncbi:unnamed protein product [Gongylonema pulchrum]|uniref:Zf-MYST domain-containing protein n=1 Tax=Gongylonema pulchrum TaxID=637853 RepID=A0A183EY22_9BILA|nr:unnamed protein product [Gongylonema pulchrum]
MIGFNRYCRKDVLLILQINDRWKDICREKLAEKERQKQEDLKRQSERENFSPRKRLRAKFARKMKRSDSEDESSRKVRVIERMKFALKREDSEEEISEAEKQRIMKEASASFDYNLYMIAKKELLATESSEEMNAVSEEAPGRKQWIQFGSQFLLALYPSPYPKRIAQSPNVYICRFCLTAMANSTMYQIHMVFFCAFCHV